MSTHDNVITTSTLHIHGPNYSENIILGVLEGQRLDVHSVVQQWKIQMGGRRANEETQQEGSVRVYAGHGICEHYRGGTAPGANSGGCVLGVASRVVHGH